MKKIISYSLWGTNPRYTIGAIRNAELAKVIYPDWLCRFYTGDDVPKNITDHLLALDAEVIDMNGTGWNGMFWRFLAADSDNIIISRDTDSRLNQREKFAVDEWLNSPWEPYFLLGRWALLLQTVCQTNVEVQPDFWEKQTTVIKQMQNEFTNRLGTEEEAGHIKEVLGRIKPVLEDIVENKHHPRKYLELAFEIRLLIERLNLQNISD